MSEGLNLKLETTAMAIITWMNDEDKYSDNIKKAIDFIVSKVKRG